MPQAVIGTIAQVLVSYGVKAAIAKFAATIFVYAATAYLLNRAQKSMLPKDKTDAVAGADINYYDSGAPIRIAYGMVRTGGMETIPPLVGGTNNKMLHKVLTLAGHEIDSFLETFFDSTIIVNSYVRAMSYTGSDGAVLSGPFSGNAYIRRYRGTSTDSADRILSDFDTIFATFRGRGFAKMMLTFAYDEEVYKQLPDVQALYRAKKCYDPRLDVSPGASPTNAAYARWGVGGGGCPALALADYLMSDYGGSYESGDIDWPLVVTAANACDALVERPTSYTLGGSFATTNVTQSGMTFTKTGGVNGAWDASFHSVNGYDLYALTVTFRAMQTNRGFMVSLNRLPASSVSYTDMDNAIYCRSDGLIEIYENNTSLGTFGSYTTSTLFEIRFQTQPSRILYMIDNFVVREVFSTVGVTKHIDASIADTGGSVQIGVGRRYSTNGVLQATTPFPDNVKTLVNSMLGKIMYADGKWRMFAGAWKTPTFTIQKNDWISNVAVKFEQGKAKRYNRMHGWFIDPKREWQRVECYPRSNPTYQTADKGEVIDAEFEDLLCTDEREMQYKTEMLLRQSRNQIIITGRLPPAFQDVALWDTGTVVMPEFGWTSKTFRAIALDVNVDGTLDGVFQEEQDSDWDDMDAGDYNNPSDTDLPPVNEITPSEPVGFSAVRQLNGTILFDWDTPVVFPAGSRYEIIRSTSTLATVSTTIWDGTARPVPLVCPTSPHWYFGRTRTPQGDLSGYSPNTFGLGVSARLEADQTLQYRIVGDAEFEFTMAASLWKSDMYFLANTPAGSNLFVGSGNTQVGTVIYNNTGGQYGGYVNFRRYSSANNSVLFQQLYTPYNEQQPDGIPYNGKPFGYQLIARMRINSLDGFTNQALFKIFSRFSTATTPFIYRAIEEVAVTSADMATLGQWFEFSRQGIATFPTEPRSNGLDVASAYGFTLIPAIATVGTTNFDVDYFQITNLGLVNYPLNSLLVNGPSFTEQYCMLTQICVNCFVDGVATFNVYSGGTRFDWRTWQIGRKFEIIKPHRVRPVYFHPGSLNPPNLILSGRTAVGTIVMNSADYAYATVEKVSATDLFFSGGGMS